MLGKIGLPERLRSWVWGKDVFISYSRRDAADYAVALAAELSKKGFACVIDQWGTRPGKTIPTEIHRALRACRSLVIVATAGACESQPVAREIEAFLPTRRLIVPINLDGTYRRAAWWPLLEGLAVTDEDQRAAPSGATIDRLVNGITFQRRDKRLRNVALGTVFLIIALMAGGGVGVAQLTSLSNDLERRLDEQKQQSKFQDIKLKSQELTLKQATTRTVVLEASEKRQRAELDLRRVELTRLGNDVRREQTVARYARQSTIVARTDQRQAVAERLLVEADGLTQRDPRVGDPSSALALAYAAKGLAPRSRAPSVIQAALRQLPRWRRIDLGGALTILDQQSNEDTTQFTPKLDRMLYRDPQTPNRMVLRDVEGGTVLGTLVISPGETLRRAPTATGELAILRSSATDSGTQAAFRVFSLADDRPLLQAALTISAAEDLVCSDGRFPCFSLSADGKLTKFLADGSSEEVGRADFEDGALLSAAPTGRSVAVIESGRATLFALGQATAPVVVTWPTESRPSSPFWNTAGDRLLILPQNYGGSNEAIAISLVGGRLTRLPLSKTGASALDIESANASPSLDKIVMGLNGDQNSTVLFEVKWNDDGSAELGTSVSMAKGGRDDDWQVGAISFTADGRQVAVARSEGGGDRTVASWIEVYDLATKGFNEPFARAFISTNGSPISRLAFSRQGGRLAAWRDEVEASIYRIRLGPTPEANTLPIQQLSALLPEDIVGRFAPRVISTRDANRFVILYGPDDLRLYDILTGREDRLPAPSLDLLDADLTQYGLVALCGRDSLALMSAGGRTIKRTLLGEPLESCGAGPILTLGATKREIYLWKTSTLEQVAHLRLDAPAAWVGWLIEDDTVWVFAKIDGTNRFERFTTQRTAGVWGPFKPVGSVTLTLEAERNPPMRRSPNRWTVSNRFLVTRQWVDQFASVLKIYDFETGDQSQAFQPPSGGWPERIEDVILARSLADGTFVLVLQVGCKEDGGGTCIAVGQWPSGGGNPTRWSITKPVGKWSSTRWDPDQTGLFVAAVTGNSLSWVHIPDGTVIGPFDTGDFSALQFDLPVAWPSRNEGRWILPSTGYSDFLDRIRSGGLDDASSLTDTSLGDRQREMVAGARNPN